MIDFRRERKWSVGEKSQIDFLFSGDISRRSTYLIY
jgi:hypothetical protein